MELSELFSSRRSVRSFKPGQIDEAVLREIVKEARLAPSWKNTETARSYVAYTPGAKEKVIKSLPAFNVNSSTNAVAYIVSTFVKGAAGYELNGEQTNEMGEAVGSYDLGLYHAYLILAAKNKGLDSLIMGIRDADVLREEFNIPENEEISMVLALGYRSDVEPNFRVRKEVDEIAKFI